MPVSFVEVHAVEKEQFNNLRILIKHIQQDGANSLTTEFCSKLCLHADQIMDTIQKHFNAEEAEVYTNMFSRPLL